MQRNHVPILRLALRRRVGSALSRQRGFTLIEIMIVVVIVGILVALVVPNIAGRSDQARRVAVENDLRAIATALDLYRADNGMYPSTDQGLRALVEKPAGYPEPKRWGPDPYLRRLPLDQWDNEYLYISTGRGFELKSMGADGQEGGAELGEDIAYADI
ncbi:MAG: type II secretion system protein GspG [Gammaproteobacteria bacterium]|nr:type II secretion system protein GspG [Gammaproteobacteria bacterium]